MKTAAGQYLEMKVKAQSNIARIESAISADSATWAAAPEPGWSDAEFMAYVAGRLEELADNLNNTGEYARD